MLFLNPVLFLMNYSRRLGPAAEHTYVTNYFSSEKEIRENIDTLKTKKQTKTTHTVLLQIFVSLSILILLPLKRAFQYFFVFFTCVLSAAGPSLRL